MTVNDRIQELVEQMLEDHSTPEEVCEQSPELLPEVRKQWEQFQFIEYQVGLFFPSKDSMQSQSTDSGSQHSAARLPQIDGYDVLGILGRGGMGVVYKARHRKLNRTVALKMLLSGAYACPLELARFQRESQTLAGVQHANIVQVFEVGDLDEQPYFTMEFVEGGSLAQSLASTPQPIQSAVALVATLANAIHVAHERGIVHRDLKPANVLLTLKGTPKVTDFGLARQLQCDADLTMAGARIGTPSYMAPEQAAGHVTAIGPAADVYALGAILYEMLTGRPPFRAESAVETERQVIFEEPLAPSRLNAKVRRDLETICLKCLHKDAVRRYDTAAALAEDLQRYSRGESILARRPSVVERTAKWINRHRAISVSVLGAFLFAATLIGGSWYVMFERAILVRDMRSDLEETARALQQSAWPIARLALERAKGRLGSSGNDELRRRVDKCERELELVERLERIRMNRVVSVEGVDAKKIAVAAYEESFRNGGFVELDASPEVTAARIKSSSISAVLIAALDDWAICDEKRRQWLLEVTQRADVDSTAREARDIDVWRSKDALLKLLEDTPISSLPVGLLTVLGERLRMSGGDAVPFFTKAQHAHPTDFWINLGLADSLQAQDKHAEAIRYYQAAIAIRPDADVAFNNLGISLVGTKRMAEALTEFQSASRIKPSRANYQYNVALALSHLGRNNEAIRELQQAIDTTPDNPISHARLAELLMNADRRTEAIDQSRQAIALQPRLWEAQRILRNTLLKLGRFDEGRTAWRSALEMNPSEHEMWSGYAEFCLFLGDQDEYRRSCDVLLSRFGETTDPLVAERTGRACQFAGASDEQRRRGAKLIDQALASDHSKFGWALPYFRVAKGMAEYREGQFAKAISLLESSTVLSPVPQLVTAMAQHQMGNIDEARRTLSGAVLKYNWNRLNATSSESWIFHILRREAESMILPQLPAESGAGRF